MSKRISHSKRGPKPEPLAEPLTELTTEPMPQPLPDSAVVSGSWLHVRAAGMDLLLSTQELREVVAPMPVSPIPGPSRGIQGVVIHEGEFLPVLAWQDLPGCPEAPRAMTAMARPMTAMAVLRPRLGLPLERMVGTRTTLPAGWRALEESHPASAWVEAVGEVDGRSLWLVDPDRLVALLRRLRGDR